MRPRDVIAQAVTSAAREESRSLGVVGGWFDDDGDGDLLTPPNILLPGLSFTLRYAQALIPIDHRWRMADLIRGQMKYIRGGVS